MGYFNTQKMFKISQIKHMKIGTQIDKLAIETVLSTDKKIVDINLKTKKNTILCISKMRIASIRLCKTTHAKRSGKFENPTMRSLAKTI